jgi:hypothetical protein
MEARCEISKFEIEWVVSVISEGPRFLRIQMGEEKYIAESVLG